jgi:peptidyl-prolyl cis-trans isomerase B (cyclophilin B)
VATNQTRRDAAKRKLANQQQRRAERAKRRQRIAIITSAVVVVVVVAGVVLLSTMGRNSAPAPAAAAPTPAAAAPTPAPAAPAVLGHCAFTPTPQDPAAKPVPVPTLTEASTSGTVPATSQTDRGPIPLTLDRATGPCAVENFMGLAKAGFYNNTPCHRLTTTDGLKVLQCGDPTGTGSGGPGYTFNDEPPTGLAPAASGSVVYPRGTVAMAKTSAPNSGGSQFFLVYADSTLPPDYTVFGTIGAPGLATLDAVAKAGSDNSNGTGDGKPVTPVQIQTVTVG